MQTSRFIPTLVGNSLLKLNFRIPRPVHPHACGELNRHRPLSRCYIGSSPRLWGTPGRKPSRTIRGRFIPTLVGNSRAVYCNSPGRTVHPHACGELSDSSLFAFYRGGSSPRLWGTLKLRVLAWELYRFIPTLVGNSPRKLVR